MSGGSQVIANQEPLYHLDATQTNPLPLRPNLGQFYQWTATSPIICHSAIGVPLGIFQCHSTATVLSLSQNYTKNHPVPLNQSSATGLPLFWHLVNALSSGSQVAVKWESSGHQVAVKW